MVLDIGAVHQALTSVYSDPFSDSSGDRDSNTEVETIEGPASSCGSPRGPSIPSLSTEVSSAKNGSLSSAFCFPCCHWSSVVCMFVGIYLLKCRYFQCVSITCS